MAENPKLENMDSDTLNSSFEACEFEEKGTQKISVSDQTNSLQYTNIKHDSFIVDMERFPHLADKDLTANSRVTLQRSLSRKASQRSGEKKINLINGNERDMIVPSSTPRAADLIGASTPEKSMVVTVATTDIHPISPQLHHQITIMTGNISGTTSTAERKCGGKRFSFSRRSSHSWGIDPRRILFFFATLSSMGTILLIYFTLSMGKLSGDGDALNWQIVGP